MNAYVVPAVIVVVGALVAWSGARLPAYTDPNWDHRFVGIQASVENSDQLSAQWYAAKAEVETPRHRRLDLGMGLVALGLSVAALFALRGVRSLRDAPRLRSPATRAAFFASAALAWLSFIPAEWLWLGYTQWRGDYPWWADSIGIPVAGVLFFGLIGLPVVLAGAAIALRGATLPVPLSTRPVFGPPFLVCTGLIVAGTLALVVLLSAIGSEPFLVPSALLTLYLLASARAAAVEEGRRL
jgi:hypothetical protein